MPPVTTQLAAWRVSVFSECIKVRFSFFVYINGIVFSKMFTKHVQLIHGGLYCLLLSLSCGNIMSNLHRDIIDSTLKTILVALINSLWPSNAIWWQRSGSTLAQVMACCLTAPSHYLNQCWLIISKVLWHSSEGIIMRRSEDTNQ